MIQTHNKCSCNVPKTLQPKKECIIQDETCGNFTLSCGCKDDIWTSPSFPVGGTVTVFYDKGCADILTVNIYLNLNIVGTLTIPNAFQGNNGNTRSITLKSFNRIEICCHGQTDQSKSCTGKFCISINYPCM
ncbi:S-Ena type endospore appendage [Bacillus sp. SM2101]|uniref:DUF3992 domain-containing protein n=1 Tax=Bacillaceae TaxID=186817 RepID=UPI001BDF541D